MVFKFFEKIPGPADFLAQLNTVAEVIQVGWYLDFCPFLVTTYFLTVKWDRACHPQGSSNWPKHVKMVGSNINLEMVVV